VRLRAGRRRYLGASAKKPIPGRADRLCCAAVRPFAVIRARLSQADRIETLLRDQAERISSLEARDPPPAEAAAAFHRLYYESEQRTWRSTRWLGVPVQKCPLDLWIYQEILTDTRPTVVIETGTWGGGSALYLASVFDLLGAGRVITIEIAERAGRPQHSRIEYLSGAAGCSRSWFRKRRR